MPAIIVSIDGTDFSGKTTISNLLLELLRDRHKSIVFKKTALPSELITGSFTKILRNSADPVSSRSFALAYALDHLHHFETMIKKARESRHNVVIVQERSLLSSLIYQGILGDVDISWLREINKYDDNYPDLTLILKVSLEEIMKRKGLENRQFDKFEADEHIKRQIKAYYDMPKDLVKMFNVEYIDANRDTFSVAKKCADRVGVEIQKIFKI